MEAYYHGILLFLTIVFIIFSGTHLKWHPFISLLAASLFFGLLSGIDPIGIVKSMSTGFGSIIGAIGLIVVLGSILGSVLEESGSVKALGNKLVQHAPGNPSMGIAILGMILGIPVFCDSGFIILISLTRSIAANSKIALPTLSLSLSGGLYTTHTLVPPTPGPVAAAGNFDVTGSLGLIILLGIVVSIPVVLVAHAWAKRIGPRLSFSNEDLPEESTPIRSMLYKALVLLILPIALIALASLISLTHATGFIVDAILFIGSPILALLLTVSLGLFLFRSHGQSKAWIEKGIYQAGPILLLTGCGGAFGMVMKESPFTMLISDTFSGSSVSGIGFLGIAFFISALFKTAQGSSTSSIVITSALLAPLAFDAGFESPVELSLLVLAVGAGSMVVSHANDSYFWVVSQFTGFDLNSAYRGITVMSFLQGISALLVIVLLYLVLV